MQFNRKIFLSIVTLLTIIVFIIAYLFYVMPINGHRVFGVTYMTMNNPFYEIINNELKKNIEKNGDRLITLDPQLDIDKQNKQIYSFIEQKVDGIFINPIDAKKIEPALKAAKKAHIPIITVDAPVTNKD